MANNRNGLMGDLDSFYSDTGTFLGKPGLRQTVRVGLVKPGAQAVLFFRFYKWLYNMGLRLLPEFLSRINLLLTGAEIDPGAEIGPGCRIGHASGVVIGRGVIIGKDSWILNNVTLGGRGHSRFHVAEPGYPTLGDDVILYTGVTVLGNVVIGDGAVIGAHSLVLDSIPAGALAVGSPARVIKTLSEG
jgi:serine O-acetyltransferase